MSVLLTWDPTPAERRVIEQSWPTDRAVRTLGELTGDEVEAALPTVEVLVGYMRSIPRERLASAAALRLVHVLGHGVDGLLTPDVVAQLRERHIAVARSNPCAVPIAEFTVMAMIALSRRLVRLHERLAHAGDWSTDLWARRGDGTLGGELFGSTLGIVGYGNIGQEVHARVRAFGMRVGALARRPAELTGAGLDFVQPWAELDAFLGACDHVVLTLPLTPRTRGLIGREQVAAMRPGAFLVNVSRGPLVDEDALVEGLSSGHLGGAALDVFASEESSGRHGYPTKYPVHQYNTILTPHYSGATAEARERALTTVGDNLRRLSAGRPLQNEVQLDRGF
jgi:phosphoglycerate dehydrogenase-like enzyme